MCSTSHNCCVFFAFSFSVVENQDKESNDSTSTNIISVSSTEISGISTLSYLREKCKPFGSLCLGGLLKNDSMLDFAVRLAVFCLSCKIF